MKISALCVTYGRVARLQEAIQCFLDQTWLDKELIIYNTFDQQTFLLNATTAQNITVINAKEREPSLGQSRNAAINAASGTHLVTWDDDCIYSKDFLATIAKHFDDGIDYVWLDRQMYSEGTTIKNTMPGSTNVFAFTKAAWEKVGGYSELTVSEDKNFVGKVTAQCQGKKVSPTVQELSFVYCWGNNVYHVSGLGEDNGKHAPAHERIERDLIKRVKEGLEPTGVIELKPALSFDWHAEIDRFKRSKYRNHGKTNDACIVLMGRFGDLTNALPIAEHIADNYGKPYWIVSKEFVSLFDGVSYVEPIVLDIPYDRPDKAIAVANDRFKFVLKAQIYGKNYPQVRMTPAYNMESWRNCGFLPKFNDKTWKLVFDRRDPERERQLVNYVTGGGKHKIILVQTTSSVSSPFAKGKDILNLIGESFGDRFRIVDLATLHAERIYDLIGLMDAAECLVSCDSSPLHLAAASNVPVVALVNNRPWLGTVPRCNCVARIPYDQAERAPMRVLKEVEKVVQR